LLKRDIEIVTAVAATTWQPRSRNRAGTRYRRAATGLLRQPTIRSMAFRREKIVIISAVGAALTVAGAAPKRASASGGWNALSQ
jgi:hypothetical protein